jgi:hypothetical protein
MTARSIKFSNSRTLPSHAALVNASIAGFGIAGYPPVAREVVVSQLENIEPVKQIFPELIAADHQ